MKFAESGLEFKVENNKLIYDKNHYLSSVDWVKTFEEGSYAYKDPDNSIDPLYFGARYFEKTNDEDRIIANDFMADITVLEAGKIGKEFIKTVGHYHKKVEGTNIAYPEIYEPLSSDVEYLLQTEPNENQEVDVLWVITKPGDKVLMLPGYGHVSMNVGAGVHVEIDIQKRDLPKFSDYSIFKKYKGGALYRTENGLEKNPSYKIRSLRVVKPKEVPEWGLSKSIPLYTAMVTTPEKFEYLKRPQDFTFEIDKFFEDAEL